MRVNSCKCDTCIHNNVCSFKDEYRKVYDYIEYEPGLDCFSASLLCDNYKHEKDWSERI